MNSVPKCGKTLPLFLRYLPPHIPLEKDMFVDGGFFISDSVVYWTVNMIF